MLHPDTKILMESGELKRIDDINIGDSILSPIGPTEVLNKIEYTLIPVCKVLITGFDSIICSPTETFFMTLDTVGYNYIVPKKENYVVYYKNDLMELILIDQVHELGIIDRLVKIKVNETFNLLVDGHIIIKA